MSEEKERIGVKIKFQEKLMCGRASEFVGLNAPVPVQPQDQAQYNGPCQDAAQKTWCAMCGKWTDHGSGSCPELAHIRKEESTAQSELGKELAELRKDKKRLREALEELLRHHERYVDRRWPSKEMVEAQDAINSAMKEKE